MKQKSFAFGGVILALFVVGIGMMALRNPPWRPDSAANQGPTGLLSTSSRQPASIAKSPTEPSPSLQTIADSEISQSDFKRRLQIESEKIALLDENPGEIEKTLREFSEGLNESEVKELYEMSLDLKQPQDERFLAVTLLAWTKKSQAGILLERIVLTKIDPSLSPGPHTEFEEILRMKAIEGLRELPLSPQEHQSHLSTIIQSTSNQQLLDRAQRALWASQGLANPPEQQDQEALKKLLEKSPK